VNLAEIRNTIQSHGYGPDTEMAQNLLINAVYREVLNHRRWPWLRRTAGALLPSGSNVLDFSAIVDLRDVDAVRFDDIEDPAALELEEIRARAHLRSVGPPAAWARTGQTVEVWPRADRDYPATIDYIVSVPPLANDFDTPVIPEEHHDVLVYGAISRLGIRERDTNVRQLLREDYTVALASLRAAAGFEQRQTSRQVTITGVHNGGRFV